MIAAPTYAVESGVNQDYVFNWVRDAALTAVELAAAGLPTGDSAGVQPLIDYVNFAQKCQDSQPPTIGHARYTIEGQPRPWTEQSDGPALQTLAILQAFPQLDAPTQATAASVIRHEHQLPARRVPGSDHEPVGRETGLLILRPGRCAALFPGAQQQHRRYSRFRPPPRAPEPWLQNALAGHLESAPTTRRSCPRSPPDTTRISTLSSPASTARLPYTDTKLLATAAQLRRQWADSSAPTAYPINAADAARGIGPLLGRYPGDSYDGDTADPVPGGHPWALCTAHFAQLYYGLANAISQAQAVPFDDLCRLLRPRRDNRGHTLERAGHRAAQCGRPDARRGHLPQRSPGTQRAVRRDHRLREERAGPDLELRGVPGRGPGENRAEARTGLSRPEAVPGRPGRPARPEYHPGQGTMDTP